ncbi:type VI secretion system lipoprotein TssJ [Pseudomonas chlororaphis]|uniref:type VI secretion system lipoprotein TssJ n=1 Tax=Pseudomonas chlororaphis TaxID=587753 RepID=UPI0007B32F32|nr:type VI secretion system lipoprotein TssJ [Pseudomonas chlororaphis]AZC57859.1 Type VI secretion lipoprotein/VasD [Pseudomonas chlororaphis subsp. piscium]AZC64091.1 Type VI secretion lipoprotein/VasD [Pseudomonas chlororaphis subsp. piscium]AZC70314.1 Type VI secretion lipoprotein/VasD [Pseudomonas chlororaphis subsp. piscium]AZC82805.1 Type VI secretion lipoprotein/VasD [Pseudomonas chlororaphis subsp. piscium]AZC90002.1 Type VI secretion lipoprotein/VasD [Pseudomonas chlororaphis subsp. 
MPKFLLFATVLLLTACASSPPPPNPTVVVMHIQAAADLNLSAGGQATPVRVRLYELKSGAVFSRADYFSLVNATSATLSTDLVAQDELLIQPGQQLTLERKLDEQSRLLGLVVSYRELDSAVWRQMVSIPSNETTPLTVSLTARAISAAATKPVN